MDQVFLAARRGYDKPAPQSKCELHEWEIIFVAHNHPSDKGQYSPEDIEVSRRLKEAGNYIGIEVLDSIIVSHHNEGLSLKEKG